MDILLQLGMAIVAGVAGGGLLHRLGLPRVVGQIVVGLLLGQSLLGWLPQSQLADLEPLQQIALGFIGFMVGGELDAEVFRKYGTKFLVIMLCEGLLAAFAVGVTVTVISGQPALGLLLGALASATAPAATVNVLWEYRSKGPLTTSILAIVALDDGLGVVLYTLAVAAAQVLLGAEAEVGWKVWAEPLWEIAGSLMLGGAAGLLLEQLLRRWLRDADRILSVATGLILLNCGVAAQLGLSQILANLVMGAVLVNALPNGKERAFDRAKTFTPPLYVLFFVFIGARLEVQLLASVGVVGLGYVVARTAGKMAGARLGGHLAHAPPAVSRYLGWALFSQAGVAIGLALDVSHRFSGLGPAAREVGDAVLGVIAATTVIVQILGPPAVKHAIRKAGEIPAEATSP